MKKILIIDDDARNIFALSAVLKSRSFFCLSASGAQKGIDILKQNDDVDVILLDIMMPDIDGIEAIALIKALPGYTQTPIIAVTAQAMVGDRERCLEAGADGYISKPVDVDELLKLLDQFINKQTWK